MSNTKKTWKEKLLTFVQENAEYFEGISYIVSGADFIPFNR